VNKTLTSSFVAKRKRLYKYSETFFFFSPIPSSSYSFSFCFCPDETDFGKKHCLMQKLSKCLIEPLILANYGANLTTEVGDLTVKVVDLRSDFVRIYSA